MSYCCNRCSLPSIAATPRISTTAGGWNILLIIYIAMIIDLITTLQSGSWYVGTSATPLCIMGLMCICNCADRWRCFPTLFRLNRTSNEQIVELTIYQGEKMRCVVLWVVRSVEDQVVDCYLECNQEQNKAMVVRFGPRA